LLGASPDLVVPKAGRLITDDLAINVVGVLSWVYAIINKP
jgi:hypothetical protein